MSELSDPRLQYRIPLTTVAATLEFLRVQGDRSHEGVVLWPGRLLDGVCIIVDALVPAQITGRLFYRIPDDEVFRIIMWAAPRGLVIPIQVHSHEGDAFHSWADDEYAFVQHENGVSIVVPDFAEIAAGEFLDRCKFYRLTLESNWVELTKPDVNSYFTVEHAG